MKTPKTSPEKDVSLAESEPSGRWTPSDPNRRVTIRDREGKGDSATIRGLTGRQYARKKSCRPSTYAEFRKSECCHQRI